jgi:dolichyl-phosphate-mannose--protein O-mannosyl transferase
LSNRDWRSGAILAGIIAGWVPWLLYLDRTIFTFYTVAYLPFLVMAVAFTIMKLLQHKPPQQQPVVIALIGIYLLAVIAAAWWFYPIWTGEVIPYDQWKLRMWMPTWI